MANAGPAMERGRKHRATAFDGGPARGYFALPALASAITCSTVDAVIG